MKYKGGRTGQRCGKSNSASKIYQKVICRVSEILHISQNIEPYEGDEDEKQKNMYPRKYLCQPKRMLAFHS